MTIASLETIVVVLCNGMTVLLASALLLIVLWQAPYRRVNQSLSLMMFCLAAYGVLNAFSRFLAAFAVSAQMFWYLLFDLYGIFTASVLLFVLVYLNVNTINSRLFVGLTISLVCLSLIALHSGLGIV